MVCFSWLSNDICASSSSLLIGVQEILYESISVTTVQFEMSHMSALGGPLCHVHDTLSPLSVWIVWIKEALIHCIQYKPVAEHFSSVILTKTGEAEMPALVLTQ